MENDKKRKTVKMAKDINKLFDEIIYDLTGKEKTLDKSEKIVYDTHKINVSCNSFEEMIDLYYKDTVNMNVSCECGTKYKVYAEPTEITWKDIKFPRIEISRENKRDSFYCLKCGIPIYITGGQIKTVKIKEFKV